MADGTPGGLGRLYAPDQRDSQFPMAAVVPATTERTYRYWWTSGAWLDQGAHPHCVGFAWTHWVADGPVAQEEHVDDPFARRLYHEAQKVDEWPGEGYAGTSVRAGAKVLQRLGFIAEYRWAFSADEVRLAILEEGPVVVGTRWYADMSRPRDNVGGRPLLQPSGALQGGHAYLISGLNLKLGRSGLYRVKNSWGRGWADRGFAWIEHDDLDRLIAQEGEACLALEKVYSS